MSKLVNHKCLFSFVWLILLGAAPPPLPPKSPSATRTKLPVESRVTSHGPISPERGSALSCPSCFCLNSGDAKTCLFCKKPLPTKTNQESSNQAVPTRQTESVETRNFPPPLWALSSDQRGAGRQMQQSPGNVNISTSTGAGLFKIHEFHFNFASCYSSGSNI